MKIYESLLKAHYALERSGLHESQYPFVNDRRSGLSDEGWIFASDLMNCPKYAVFKRKPLKEQLKEAKFPDLVQENLPQASMDAANRGRFLQQALMYSHQGAYCEVSLRDEGLKVRGRIDVLLAWEGHILEIKGKSSKTHALSIAHIFQTLFYGYVYGDAQMHVVTVTADEQPEKRYKVWTLNPSGSGFYITDEKGKMWKHPMNTPNAINYDSLKSEVERQHKYFNGEWRVPFTDIFNDSERDSGAWRCSYKWQGYPPSKVGATGIALCTCPIGCFFTNPEIEVIRNERGSYARTEIDIGF